MSVRHVVGVAAAAVLLAACGGGGSGPTVQKATSTAANPSSSASAPSSPSSTSSSSSTASGVPSSIATGQCLGDTTTYQVVPCTRTHVYQVTAVIKDSRSNTDPTARQVLRQESCNASMVKFSGGGPVGLLAVANPAALVDDPLNASRIVCLMHLRTDGDEANLPIDYSLQGKVKGALAYKLMFCVDKVAKNFKIVRCSEPHTGQSVGGYAAGPYNQAYPGEAALVAQRSKQCPPRAQDFLGGSKPRPDIQQVGLYVNPTAWAQGDRYGVCFVKVTSGTVKKSLQGIGVKPLTSYR